MTYTETAALYQVLVKAKRAYYAGSPFITDYEFDMLEDLLRRLAPDHKYFDLVGTGEP